MINLEHQILLALLLDIIIGDPRWLPHPVRLIGKLIELTERILRKSRFSEFWQGIQGSLLVIFIALLSCIMLKAALAQINPLLEDIVSIYIIYSCISLRDLISHAKKVYYALKEDIIKAREKVSRLVGRDTSQMNEIEIIRATVESVAENLVDGITAPLLFAFIGGAELAVVYKVINTLDSMWGYKNKEYLNFGRTTARLDDFANYIPARLTVPIMVFSAFLVNLNPIQSFKTLTKDGRKHPSPNSGLAEAAMSGALGIQLGGVNYYKGIRSIRPTMGLPINRLKNQHIVLSCILIAITSIIFFTLLFMIRLLI